MFYVYVLQSVDEKRDKYIGFTSDLRKRLNEHNSSGNRGYTRGRQWRLIYYEAYLSEKDCRRREKRLKDDGRARRQLTSRLKESLSG